MTSIPLLRGVALATLLSSLTACGGQDEAPTPPEPPAVEAPVDADEDSGAHEEHEDDDHAEHDDHDDEHDDHDEHDEDHHAGGEAHEHGVAEAALVLQDDVLTLSIDTPLSSFGVREAAPETEAQQAEVDALRDALVSPDTVFSVNAEAGCGLTESDVAFRHSGDHGSATLTYTFQCDAPGALDEIGFNLFSAYPGFEEIEAVILNGTAQSVGHITEQVPMVAWPRGE
ncbi:MAG: DUF2796 domain-containing protein [Hyphomonadaceae bacterium]|nr:DUF2796 domain-containing protein [Hyphomonadaceae bacterium]